MWFRTKLIVSTYFIPHYGVFKTSQDGKTKSLSGAFNASAKTASTESFND